MGKKNRNKIAIILASIGSGLLLLSIIWMLFLEGPWVLKQNEKKAVEGAKEYFLHYPKRLPEKVGDYTKLTLNDLYGQKFIDTLLVPKQQMHTCSTDSSWIKVFKNEKEEYDYYVYLECGKYHSNIDHEGPVIELNGEETVFLGVGEEYKEQGVKSIVDQKDGTLDTKNVLIDQGGLDTTKIGDYKVTYTAYDSLRNRTDKVRMVSVRKYLKEEVEKSTDVTNTYKGNTESNYLLFSGMLWRIVKMNEDGTIRLISEDSLAVLNYGNASSYQESNIASWLNEYFYPLLKNKQYIKEDAKWCLDSIDEAGNTKECSAYSSSLSVGSLSVSDYKSTYDENGNTFLQTQMLYWLSDVATEEESYSSSKFASNFNIYTKDRLMGVRAVIDIKTDALFITGGIGTKESPYKLNDMEYGRDNEPLNERYVGEYVNYSGQVFRIAGFDEEGNTKLVGVTNLLNSSTGYPIATEYKNESGMKKFNLMEEGNIGRQLNEEYINYLDDRLMVEHTYQVPTFDVTKKWNEVEQEEIKGKIMMPKTSEIFSGQNSDEQYVKYNYWLMDFVPNENHFIMVNSANGLGFDTTTSEFRENAFKILIYLDQSAKLSSGNGTSDKPYYVK